MIQSEVFPERNVAVEYSVIFLRCEHRKLNSFHLNCTGVEAEISETEIRKLKKIKTKLNA